MKYLARKKRKMRHTEARSEAAVVGVIYADKSFTSLFPIESQAFFRHIDYKQSLL